MNFRQNGTRNRFSFRVATFVCTNKDLVVLDFYCVRLWQPGRPNSACTWLQHDNQFSANCNISAWGSCSQPAAEFVHNAFNFFLLLAGRMKPLPKKATRNVTMAALLIEEVTRQLAKEYVLFCCRRRRRRRRKKSFTTPNFFLRTKMHFLAQLRT